MIFLYYCSGCLPETQSRPLAPPELQTAIFSNTSRKFIPHAQILACQCYNGETAGVGVCKSRWSTAWRRRFYTSFNFGNYPQHLTTLREVAQQTILFHAAHMENMSFNTSTQQSIKNIQSDSTKLALPSHARTLDSKVKT